MTQLQDSELIDTVGDLVSSYQEKPKPLLGGTLKLFVGIGIGIAIALLGTRLLDRGAPAAGESPGAQPAAPVSTQTVTIAPVQMGGVTERLTITGTVQAADLIAVMPQLSGLPVREVLVQVGDRVAAGQPLIVLDDAELQTQIQQAQAQIEVAQAQQQQQEANLAQSRAVLAEAEANLQRYQSLAGQGAVSAEELDSRATQATTAREAVGVAEATVASAAATVRSRQSDLARLQTQLARTTVYAPTDGIVAERPITVGSVSATSTAVVTLIRGNELELAGQVPQAQLPQVQVGAPAIVTSSTDPAIRVAGTVQEIQPLVDPQTRTAEVTIRLPVSDRLRSGMFLTAEIQVSQGTGLMVPAPAILPQADGSMQVLVLGAEGTAIARTVEIGSRVPGNGEEPDRVEIVQGLSAGEQVIVAGASYVQDGDVVTVGQ